jgi:hypothetical protein
LTSEDVVILSLNDMNDDILRTLWVLRELEDSDNDWRDNMDSIAEYVKLQAQGAWSIKSARMDANEDPGRNGSWNARAPLFSLATAGRVHHGGGEKYRNWWNQNRKPHRAADQIAGQGPTLMKALIVRGTMNIIYSVTSYTKAKKCPQMREST